MQPVVETQRLLVTLLAPDMAKYLYINSQDDDMRRFVPDEVWESEQEAAEIIDQLIHAYGTADGPFVYAVQTRQGRNIGYVQACRLEAGFEVGYHIARPWTGQGYATEALSAFLPFIAEKLEEELLLGVVLEENAASQRVLEKCSFVLKEIRTALYQGKLCPLRVYQWKRG